MTHDQAIDILEPCLDGELDDATLADVERHIESCQECQALARAHRALSNVVAAPALYYEAPPQLPLRIMARISPASAWNLVQRWARLSAAAAVIALAISSSLALLSPLPGGDPTYQYVIDSFKKATPSDGNIDVAISSPGVIDAWLASRVRITVPTRDAAIGGCHLNGVRIDHIDQQSVAVLVYHAGASRIEVFEWPDTDHAQCNLMTDQVGDYSVARWSTNHTQFWAVTATHDKSMAGFQSLVNILTALPTTAPASAP